MKTVIHGKKYDTDTAHEIFNYDNNRSWNDFKYLSESLYQKKNGEFFIFGEGGAMTEYSKPVENGAFGFGQKIIPLSIDEAKSWAEAHFDGDLYEKVFGPVAE